MSEPAPKSSKKETAVKAGGGIASLLSGVWVSHYLNLPNGLPESAFKFGIAPLAALAGFEYGQKMRAWNKALGGVIALSASVISYFLYYLVLEMLSGGIFVTFLIFVLFASTFFCFFFGMGVFSIWIFGLKKEDS